MKKNIYIYIIFFLYFPLFVIVTTCGNSARTFLPSVFHAQSDPHAQSFQEICLFCEFLQLLSWKGNQQLAEPKGETESYNIVFCPATGRILTPLLNSQAKKYTD